MGVHDVRLELAAQSFDVSIGRRVVIWVRIPHQVRCDHHAVTTGSRPFHERSFGSGTWAREQGDLMPAAGQAFAGQQRIFLGPADDEPGDDVENFHCVRATFGVHASACRRGSSVSASIP